MHTTMSIRFITRKLIAGFLLLSLFPVIHSQSLKIQQQGLTSEENIRAILNLKPYSIGVLGFDNRYQGIKGSPRLFDTLVTSFLKVKGLDYYIQLKTDIDLVNNTLLFIHPRSGSLTQIPSEIVTEVVINKDERELTYRTFEGKILDRDLREKEFCQLLTEKPVMFLKLPVKKMVEADYDGAYSPDRRYDEFLTFYRYYIMGSDSTFHQLHLSKKSLIKLFPGKKAVINEGFGKAKKEISEEMIMSILEKF